MSDTNTTIKGHVLKVRDPKERNIWYDVPVLYSTIYQSYVTYCTQHVLPILTEDEFYALMVNMQDAINTINNFLSASEGKVMALDKGGTGVSVKTIPQLLNYLGLIVSSSAALPNDNTFPTTMKVHQDILSALQEAKSYVDNNKPINDTITYVNGNKIGSGTSAPPSANPNNLKYYIKYV